MERQALEEEEAHRKDVKLIEDLVYKQEDNAILEMPFMVISVLPLCDVLPNPKTLSRGFAIPGEIGVALFSFLHGILDNYATIIDPGGL